VNVQAPSYSPCNSTSTAGVSNGGPRRVKTERIKNNPAKFNMTPHEAKSLKSETVVFAPADVSVEVL